MLQEELNAYKKKEKNKKSKVYDNNNINEGDFIENKFKLILNENIIKDQNLIKENLKKDILDYQKFVKRHSEKNEEMNKKILEKIQNNINKINTDFKAKLYGSRATNLSLMWSDIDIVIIKDSKNDENNNIVETKYDFLQKLYEYLNEDVSFVENIKYINKAKVPIIKIKASKEYDNVMIDITIQTKEHFGLKCVNLVKKLIQKYEHLEPLLFPLKTLLKISELNDPYNGGLSSYALILMIVNFLEKYKNINMYDNNNIGNLFYQFLYFYGGRLDTNYIDFNNTGNNTKINKSPFICIIDPLNKDNNVTKSSFKFLDIKFLFLMALQIINEPCFCGCHYNLNKNNQAQNNKINENFCECNLLNKIFFGIKRGKPNYSFNKK